MSVTWTLIGHYLIGEYSATKIHFFLWRRKNCEKDSPYFSLSGVEKFPNLHFFGKNFSRLALRGKLQIFAKKVPIWKKFSQKSANQETFSSLKVKNREKLFHNFFASGGKMNFCGRIDIHLCFLSLSLLHFFSFKILLYRARL